MKQDRTAVAGERIVEAIVWLRGQKVMLDADLARLYGVPTGRLNEQVARNRARFPEDFMFQLTAEEAGNLKSQSAISSAWGGRRKLPYAFTEQGVAMLSSVLRSRRAVLVNIEIMRAFVKLRGLLASHEELSRKLDALDRKYDASFADVFEAIRQMMRADRGAKRRIGFGERA